MIPRNNRLTRSAVTYALKKGHRVSNEYFNIKFIPSRGTENRYSASVSTKVFPNAVDRNRLRRRLYEIIRKSADSIPKPFNIVIIAKNAAAVLDWQKLNKHLIQTLQKIHG